MIIEYIIGMCAWAFVCYYGTTIHSFYSFFDFSKYKWWSDRTDARWGLLSPIWPLGLVFFGLKLVFWSFIFTLKTSLKIWKTAEISFPKLKENKPGQLSLIEQKNEIEK